MPRDLPRFVVVLALSTGLGSPVESKAGDESKPTEEQARFFEAKVRPILLDQCAKCHGADKQKAGLRLDTRAGALAGGDTGPAVVPGKPDESLLVNAIRHEDDGPKMPPAKKLPAATIADLTRWVEMGAPWPGGDTSPGAASTRRKGGYQITDQDRAHWAFQPIRRPDPPHVSEASWRASPIDAFIFAGLEAKGLTPSPPASKQTLIRRATYDLTGLPPTPAEVEAFVYDPSPRAYEALLDRLLASDRHGEKWGRHWLDLVRFAETNSYERDGAKPNAWRYRDYVIRSLNADKPFDQFAREQLAGDEIPDPTPDSIIATGYYRLGIWDDEPSDRELARYDALDDIVATTGQVFLGLTVDCARCHDHKLDPIPQKDYYRLVSFFQNITSYRNGGPTDEVPLFSDPKARQEHETKVRSIAQRRDAVQAEIASIEDEFRSRSNRAERTRPDLEGLRYRYYRDTWDHLPDFASLKPETAGDLPKGLFDLAPRSRNDAFGFVFEGTLVVPVDGKYTFELDSDDGSRLLVDGKAVLELDGIRVLGKPASASLALTKSRLPIRLDYFQRGSGLGLNVVWSGPGFSRKSLSATDEPASQTKAKTLDAAELARLVLSQGAKVLGPERSSQYRALRREIREIQKAMNPAEMALCVTEAGGIAPETYVLLRGNPQSKGDTVEPGFLQVLGGAPAKIAPRPPHAHTTGRRTALAEWITSPTHPLTARVIANRVWQHHFGRGIVRSVSNFGLQGDRPTHPALLDWLASELVANGWRLKPLHKTIMMSNAYRMSSSANPKSLATDPVNDSFWRFDMRRLSAEEIRDSILAVTGSLNLKMYGPGVYPAIPAEVMAGQSVPGAGWGKSTPEEQARRSVYIHVKRSLITPILESFDVAETDRSSPNRFVTTQPTQALAMLNGSFLNAQAVALAARLKREAGDDSHAQVELALRLVTARSPTEIETRRGLDMIAELTAANSRPEDALKSFCLVVLNLNEFLYLD